MSSPLECAAVHAFLFDMDGTVMDSHPVWDEVLSEMCVEYRGTPLTEVEAKTQFGLPLDKVADNLFPDMDREMYHATLEIKFVKHVGAARVLDGAAEMLAAARAVSKGRIALVTNCSLPLTRHLVERHPLLKDSFGHSMFCAMDILPDELPASVAALLKGEEEAAAAAGKPHSSTTVPSKPSPMMLHLAAHHLGVDLANCVMVGDTVNDIKAANNAGCRSIAINWTSGHSFPEATFNTQSVLEVAGVIMEQLCS